MPIDPRLAGRKAFIALPVYREVDALFTQCLLRLVTDPPCDMQLRMNPGDSLVSRARNTLTAEFLRSDCTDLLFIDTDLVFSNDHIARILTHDVPVVGGFYPKKQEGDLAWVCNGLLDPEPPREDGLQRVRYMGTGFLRIQRTVFEQMIAAYAAQLAYEVDQQSGVIEHDFWSVGVYQWTEGAKPCARYLSEDWFFCQRWLDLGGSVFGDTRIVLKHVGQAVYPLSYQNRQLQNPVSAASPLAAGLPSPGSDFAPVPGPLSNTSPQSHPVPSAP